MRYIPKQRRLLSTVQSKRVDIAPAPTPRPVRKTNRFGGVSMPVSSSSTGGNTTALILNIVTQPPEPKLIESSPEDTLVCYVETSPLGVELSLVDDAGGKYKIVNREIRAASVLTDYETSPVDTITVQAGVGIGAITRTFSIEIIDIDDGGAGTSYLLDELGEIIRDEDGNIIWD